ncbi:hypothetical protein QYE76_017485 [Lolium multiflorum]|uniref:Uncharacterized protein n=1 Tax=Lolium multiflorum TaxID=4521 RepID=A0AAD8VDE9_LOLMU|nr:hypothetical protein QYE76_017485 [Lolium multiflorum]
MVHASRQRVVVTRFRDLIHPRGRDAGSFTSPGFHRRRLFQVEYAMERVVKQFHLRRPPPATHAVHTSASHPQQADHGEFPLVTFLSP